MITSGPWAPFVGPDLPDGGPVAQIVTQVLQSEGYQPEIRFTTWSLALDATKRGENYGSFPFASSGERRADYYLSDPLINFDYVLFYDKARKPAAVDQPEDLRELRIARIAGYDYWPELEEAVTEFIPFNSSLEAFQALARGEVDLVPESRLSGQAVLADPGFAYDSGRFDHLDYSKNPLLGSVGGMHFMFPKQRDSEKLLSRFNEALASYKKTDEYRALTAGLTDGAAGDEVTLHPHDDGLVSLIDPRSKSILVTPTGTRALVLDWPEPFVTGSPNQPTKSIMVPVKVLDGPATGRVLEVDARSLQLRTGTAKEGDR
ncbi:substrate-binding periplasmic protein [Microlunatus sp. GCM10028923]|uniref:substrate-binding periplasmic protein n=1 Tax=Microlunatus sp. GCM10028923 TaxID=3273400 RepID=UPI00360B45FD